MVSRGVSCSLVPASSRDLLRSSAHATEDYTIELPKKMKVLSIPQDMKIANYIPSYTATYRLKGNLLTVHRILDDRPDRAATDPPRAAVRMK
jgi:hypothetical protein